MDRDTADDDREDKEDKDCERDGDSFGDSDNDGDCDGNDDEDDRDGSALAVFDVVDDDVMMGVIMVFMMPNGAERIHRDSCDSRVVPVMQMANITMMITTMMIMMK